MCQVLVSQGHAATDLLKTSAPRPRNFGKLRAHVPHRESLEIPFAKSSLTFYPIHLEDSPLSPVLLEDSHLNFSLSICLGRIFELLKITVTSHLQHITSLSPLITAQTCPATTPISSCAASKLESHSEDFATSVTASARSATPTYALPHSFVSVMSVPSGTTRTSALSAAEKASAMPFTALNAQDLRRTATDAQRLSIWALQGLICMFNPIHL